MNCDRPAFEEAFAVGTTKTVRFLLSKGCTAEEAEELAQIAWSKAWEKRDQFRGDCPLANWVISIALNLLRCEWRRPKRVFVEESTVYLLGRPAHHDAKILVEQILALVNPATRQLLIDGYITERIPRKGNSQIFHAVRRARKAGTRARLIAKARQAAA
jgi:DNA-directed RNA polymerase specialized sigma24 family protein